MKDRPTQEIPPPVPRQHGAKQGGEIPSRWDWVEASVWTERMLATLEHGVKGGKWFSLIDKVYNPTNLYVASERVIANDGSAGVDRQPTAQFERQRHQELPRLEQELREGRYQPQPARRTWIEKTGSRDKRPLGIPAVRDRVVQTAVRNVLEPIFEREFAEHSYGFRPKRGCRDALRRVDSLLRQGNCWVVDADLKSYFDTIPHDLLMQQVSERIADGRVLQLIEAFLKQGVMEELKGWQATERGTPQGAVISPLLANIYLNPLDHLMAQQGFAMVRYADDLVVLCPSREEAEHALSQLQVWTQARGLQLHPDKTRVVDARQPGGFDFLGYHFERGQRWPSDKSLKKLRGKLRDKTHRTDGRSLAVIIAEVNRTLRGWFGYYKHSQRSRLRHVDEWVRRRLRAVLAKRHHRRSGRQRQGGGLANRRWTNAYFHAHGLYSLIAAHAAECQSR